MSLPARLRPVVAPAGRRPAALLALRCVLPVVLLVVPGYARAEILLVPVGGRPVALGDRTVCADGALPPGGFTIEAGGREVRPPPGDDAIGQAVTLRVAAPGGRCAPDSPAVTLVAIGHPPTLNAASIAVDVDAGRLVLHGRRLRGTVLVWSANGLSGEDACTNPETTPAGESCTYALARALPADPAQLRLVVLPAGARTTVSAVPASPASPASPVSPAAPAASPVPTEVALFDAAGRRLSFDEYAVRAAQVLVEQLLPADAAADMSGGVSTVGLTHPEAVGAVECADAVCDVEGGALVVRGERGPDNLLDVHLHLRPHVLYQHGPTVEGNPVITIPLQRCPVAVASAAPLRGVADQRVVVRVGGHCARDAALDFVASSGPAPVERTEVVGADLYAVVRVARVNGEELSLTVRRGGAVVGVARVRSRRLPPLHARLEIPGHGAVDFIPTNREARVLLPAMEGVALAPEAVEGVYSLRHDAQDGDFVRGVEGAAGSVALRLAYLDRGLPGLLHDLELAQVSEPVERGLHTANVPIDLGSSAQGATPLAELLCGDGGGHPTVVAPGVTGSIPYRARETCRLVLHRERLHPEDGAQLLQLTVQVVAADGATRSEAGVDRRMTLRAQPEALQIFLHGVASPFDHVIVRLALSDESNHYAVGSDEQFGAAQLQWSVVVGTDRARLYATTAFPTGLFRVADAGHSGILTLNAGALLRLVWLSREGSESPVGLEAGVMWLGITGDTDPAAPRGEVAAVAGVGISVPIANATRASQTSINLHAWFEYEVSRAVLGQSGNAIGFVFGPSLSIGDVGTNF